jgi:hypothetical protein
MSQEFLSLLQEKSLTERDNIKNKSYDFREC